MPAMVGSATLLGGRTAICPAAFGESAAKARIASAIVLEMTQRNAPLVVARPQETETFIPNSLCCLRGRARGAAGPTRVLSRLGFCPSVTQYRGTTGITACCRI